VAQGNLEVVRPIYEAWGRGDFTAVDWAHPEIELVIADGPAPGRWTGLAQMAEAWRDMLSAWQNFRAEVQEFRELDGERVLVLLTNSGRGRASGVDVAQIRMKSANLLHIRDGKVTRLVAYWSRERAFADLGLEPEAGPAAPRDGGS
jgi:ketosteroid isomerase-like protein